MKILIISATPFEIEPLRIFLEENFEKKSSTYLKNNVEVNISVTGVGLVATAFYLSVELSQNRYDLVLQLGIAGAFLGKNLALGEVVQVVSERFGDLGVEEADGGFTDVHQLGLVQSGVFPFAETGEMYHKEAAEFLFLRRVKGLSVNKVHGSQRSIAAIVQKYDPDVESMEGASFFYACLLYDVTFLQIRAISNYVEPRNREAWNLPLAIENLNKTALELLACLL